MTLVKMRRHVILVAMENILMGNYECLSYQNVCTYKMAWHSVNTIGLNHISLDHREEKDIGLSFSVVMYFGLQFVLDWKWSGK